MFFKKIYSYNNKIDKKLYFIILLFLYSIYLYYNLIYVEFYNRSKYYSNLI